MEIALRMYLAMMVNCTEERSFSKLKRIKDAQRRTMSQNRLNNLTLMSIEYELLRKLDISAIIDDLLVKNHVNITCGVYIVEFNLLCQCCSCSTSINSCNNHLHIAVSTDCRVVPFINRNNVVSVNKSKSCQCKFYLISSCKTTIT